MAARNLTTTWKQFEKLCERYFQKKAPKSVVEELADLVVKTNESKVVDALSSLLLESYVATMSDVTIRLGGLEGKTFAEWLVQTDDQSKRITVNPVAVFAFINQCKAEMERAKKEDAHRLRGALADDVGILDENGELILEDEVMEEDAEPESFAQRRLRLFMAELSRLPSHFMLFLAILDGVARYKEVCKADKRTSSVPDAPETVTYLNLLWAFRELEQFLSDSTGINLRTEYCLTWYECQWADRKKR